MPSGAHYEIKIVGVRRAPLRDLYHAILRWSWLRTLALLVLAYVALNAVYAEIYVLIGGIAGLGETPEISFVSAYFFSVQTMGTIGYGVLHPASLAANIVVVAESITSLLFTALATGVVFAKFSRSRARVVFANKAVIVRRNDIPTLMIRIGNERGNLMVDAHIRMALAVTEKSAEGDVLYRTRDLQPLREHIMTLSRSFMILHVIDEKSPLHGMTAARLVEAEAELTISVIGLDDATMQPMHALARYFPQDILFGARYVDILSDLPDGNMLMDLRRFHDTQPGP